jgi:hypothetical protein
MDADPGITEVDEAKKKLAGLNIQKLIHSLIHNSEIA